MWAACYSVTAGWEERSRAWQQPQSIRSKKLVVLNSRSPLRVYSSPAYRQQSRAEVLKVQERMPDDGRCSWCANRNKVPNKCDVLESSPHHPLPCTGRGKIHSRKPALVPVAGERWSREMYLHRSAPFRWCCPGQWAPRWAVHTSLISFTQRCREMETVGIFLMWENSGSFELWKI